MSLSSGDPKKIQGYKGVNFENLDKTFSSDSIDWQHDDELEPTSIVFLKDQKPVVSHNMIQQELDILGVNMFSSQSILPMKDNLFMFNV